MARTAATAKMPMSPAGKKPRRRLRQQSGFTLVELLVVLTLIALIATLATPMIQRSIPGAQLQTSAERLRSELRLARSIAIRDNRQAWLLVDVEAGTYQRGENTRVQTIPPAIQLTLLTAQREQIDEYRGRIRFFPDGTSTGGSVTLAGETQAVEVAIDWFDGRVSIDETDPE